MPPDLIPSLLLMIVSLGFSPGPANIYSLSAAINYGRERALKMWLGLFVGFSITVVTLAVLTHFLGEALGKYVVWLKYVGAAYILYLAWRLYRDGSLGSSSNKGCNFLTGVIMQMTNAKMILVDLTVFSTMVLPYSSRLVDLLEVSAWLLIAGPGANLVWLLAGSWLGKFLDDYHKQVDIIAALALAACAVYIVLK